MAVRMDIKIREVTRRDFDGLLRLNRNMYKEAASNLNFGDWVRLKRPSRGNVLKWFVRLLADVQKGNAVSLMAYADGKIAGYCFVRRVEPGTELSHVGELTILVDAAYRGSGIGGKLLDSVIKQSKRKFEMLRLTVFATNEIAKKLYLGRGFRCFGTEPRAVKRGKKYINMEHYYRNL
jgi:ribosomal protein S18 acetylase RimI-like enzyme